MNSGPSTSDRPGPGPFRPPQAADAADLNRLRTTLTGAPGSELGPRLSVLSEDASYHRGTTSPVIGGAFTRTREGLIVPEGAASPMQPIDALQVFLTIGEVFGQSVTTTGVVEWLEAHTTADVLAGCAALLSIMQSPHVNLDQIGRDVAGAFSEPTATRIRNLLSQGRVLLAPQAVFKLAKMAIIHCRSDSPDQVNPLRPVELVLPLLGVQEHLGRNPRWSGTQLRGHSSDNDRGVTADVIRNQHFNRSVDEATAFATFERRWKVLPTSLAAHPEFVDLEAAYRHSTGVEIDDVVASAVALWTLAVSGDTPRFTFDESWPAAIPNWSPDRASAAIGPFTADIETVRSAINADPVAAGDDWSFDEFRRWPVIRIDGLLILLSPQYLVERVTGWTLTFDLTKFRRRATSSDQRNVNFFRQVCEAQVHESLSLIAGSSGSFRRFWSGDDLKKAFGRKEKVADAAVEYDSGWLIFEVTTSQVRRTALLSGNLDELQHDLIRFVVTKARQLDVTISRIRAEEERLTGFPPSSNRVFLPTLVLTEGMPYGPMTDACVRQILKDEGLFASEDVLPLEIIDSYDLDMLEGVLARGGGNAMNFLRSHQGSTLRNMPLSIWLLDAHRSKCRRSERISDLMESTFDRVSATLGLVPSKPGNAGGTS